MPAATAEPVSPELVGVESAAPPAGLYIHVPFCVSICPYCDFVVVAGSATRGPRNRIAEVLDALLKELDLRADELDRRWGRRPRPSRPPLETMYLGGGTPSLLPTAAVEQLLERVRGRFGLAPGAEVTIEANPGPAERGDLEALAAAGITRVSIGAQSFDPDELRRLGRRHRPADVAATVAAAHRAGVASVGLDLLYDIPGQGLRGWAATLEAAMALEPDHLSLYALTLDDPDADGLAGGGGDHLPLRAGARRWRERARLGQDDDRAAAMYELATDRLAAAGFEGYEISNWARPGHRSRHNLGYWRRRPHEAVGPGAHAFDGLERRWNAAHVGRYVAALRPSGGADPVLPPGGSTAIDRRIAAFERVVLGLRCADGIPAAWAGHAPLAAALGWASAAGLLEERPGDRLALTLRGRLLSNELFARLA